MNVIAGVTSKDPARRSVATAPRKHCRIFITGKLSSFHGDKHTGTHSKRENGTMRNYGGSQLEATTVFSLEKALFSINSSLVFPYLPFTMSSLHIPSEPMIYRIFIALVV